MANSRDFVAHIVELMRPSRAIAKAMFGGHGIYVDGLFVAIVADDTLFLKTDDASRGAFDALSLPPFEFKTKDGRGTASGYRRAPDEALESSAEMQVWLRRAVAAALAKPRARIATPRTMTVKRVR
jgi:DNA transformation protein and related proteins